MSPLTTITLVAIAAVPAPASASPDACARLTGLALPQAKVNAAVIVAAGEFSPPADLDPRLKGDPAVYKTLPAFCRVAVQAAPSKDSAIDIEVWMPVEGWNGRLRGQGNGGFAGEINFRAIAGALRQGYAVVATNTGHSGKAADASWALGHPERVADFGYRAIHVMTGIAKTAVKAYYGKDARRSYFNGCSNGGRQGLMEAQRFPADYDGVLVGAPANYWTHLLTKSIADTQATTVDPASYIPSSKVPAIAKAVNEACDAGDGLADGILDDPRRCRFDPASMLCKEADSDACLTNPQVKALRALYEGPRDAKGRMIFPGYLPGAEEGEGGWARWLIGPAPTQTRIFAFGFGYFSNIVYEKADWDYRTANVEQILAAAQEKTARTLDAIDPDLQPFRDRGGKLILFHGWNDPAISALNTIDYYESVLGRVGRKESEGFVRLYMVPGLQHCTGGVGPDLFGQDAYGPPDDPRRNALLALERWVEDGTAPATLVATRYEGEPPARQARATRLVCPYPQVTRYAGKGDPNDAASFECAAPKP
jgi:feruloyl esterase